MKYADHMILEWKERPLWFHRNGFQETQSGYGKKLSTRYVVRIRNLWHRVYTRIFFNIGTNYVIYRGEEYVISQSFPLNGITPRGAAEPRLLAHYLDTVLWANGTNKALPFPKSEKQKALRDIQDFLDEVKEDFELYLKDNLIESFAHDFYLTRCRQGAGFWDRGLKQLGDRLTKVAHTFVDPGFYERKGWGYFK